MSKYDPARRGPDGAFLADDWTSARDIGKSFRGTVLTPAAYERVEAAYAAAAIAMLREAGVEALQVTRIENSRHTNLPFRDGQCLHLDRLSGVVRAMLREEFSCRLGSRDTFVHVGWDYYMYVGVPIVPSSAIHAAHQLGLFVDEHASPYHTTDAS